MDFKSEQAIQDIEATYMAPDSNNVATGLSGSCWTQLKRAWATKPAQSTNLWA